MKVKITFKQREQEEKLINEIMSSEELKKLDIIITNPSTYSIEVSGDFEVESTGISLWIQKDPDELYFYIQFTHINGFLIQEGK